MSIERQVQPTLHTYRLTLRPFTLADAADVQRLAGVPEVGKTTGAVPYPCLDGMAEEWINQHQSQFERGIGIVYAVTVETDICGCVSLGVTAAHRRAELWYWMGVPYWNNGYTTEASAALVEYGFNTLHLHRIYASHLTRNPASGRVLQKLGMVHEGTKRQHMLVDGVFEDADCYGLLAEDWRNLARNSPICKPNG
jgi:RimJ/RimL family protein N-acetyltransferase